MGSGYFGEPNLGNDNIQRGSGSSSSSSSSSRKGKKPNSDKPRQPQRGLGVAQLEKIRLHGQMGSAYGHPASLHNPNYANFNNDDMRAQTAYSALPSSSFSYSSTSSSSSPSFGFNPNIMMGLGDHPYERTNIRYGDSQPTTTARWDPSNAMLDTQYIAQPNMTRHLLNLQIEDSQYTSQKHRSTNSLGSSSTQNSESSDTQELDLELRLSL